MELCVDHGCESTMESKLFIRITSYEPFTPVTAEISIPDELKATCKDHQQSSFATQRREVNVLNDYYNEFRRAHSLLEQGKAENETITDTNKKTVVKSSLRRCFVKTTQRIYNKK